MPPVFLQKPSVFISYARQTSAESARALYAVLWSEAFFDQENISTGDHFPARIVDALLGSRVVVVFPDEVYFERLFCRWELQAALESFAHDPTKGSLSHLVVVLPAGKRPAEIDRFPPGIQTINWTSADDTAGVVGVVRKRLEQNRITLGQRYTEHGEPESAARARLLEFSENRQPESLAGIPIFPMPLRETKGDRFVGRANDLWRIDFALGTLGGGTGAATLIGSVEGAGGVGKTQLALEYIHRFGRSRFPGGIFWVDAEEDLETQHHGILRVLNPEVPDLLNFRQEQRSAYDELAGTLHRVSSGSRILFVVDNVPEAPARPLSTWCPALNKVTVLTTSRARLSAVESAVPVPVGVLAPEAAVQLLTSGLSSPASVADCHQVAEWVGRLPLALTVLNAALRLQGTTIQKLAGRARSRAGQVDELDAHMKALQGRVPRGALRGVAEAFAESYNLLTPDAQQGAGLLARLAPSAIPVELVDALDLHPAVRMSLTGCSFVTQDESPGQPLVPVFGSMHRVLADYLKTRSGQPDHEWEIVRQALVVLLGRMCKSAPNWELMQACVAHAQHVLRTRPFPPDEPDRAIADLAFVLSTCLGILAQPDEATKAIQEATAIRRKLAETRPDEFLPDLAKSLNNLSVHLGGLGRREEGLGAVQEAVMAYRKLAEARPETFLPNLAGSLNNFSVCLGELGRREEGFEAVQEAVKVYRKLVEARADDALPNLAMALHNLSSRLEELGRSEEGLEVAQEAVKIRRKLTEANPHIFLPKLALSLNALSNRLGEVGRSEEGLVAVQEAVAIRRELAVARPTAFLPNLASSLNILSSRLGEVGRSKEGLAAVQEAVAIRREMAAARPDAFLPNLASSLNNLSDRLGELKRSEEGLMAVQEAVQVYRKLSEANSERFLPDLATSLKTLSIRLGELGHREEGMTVVQEAIEIYRKLAEVRPAVFLRDLVKSLSSLSRLLDQMGRSNEARAAADEVTAITARFPS